MIISGVASFLLIVTAMISFYLKSIGLFSLLIIIIATLLIAIIDSSIRSTKDSSISMHHCLLEYFLIGSAILSLYSILDVLHDSRYAIHYFGSYNGESSFYSCFETIPDTMCTVLYILPAILLICAIFSRRFLFLFSSFFAFIGIIANNTIRIFGEYYIISAAGNKSRRFNDVSEFAETVTIAFFAFAGIFFILTIIDLIMKAKKGKKSFIISIVTLIVGILFIFLAYNAYDKGTAFDVDQLKNNIYIETKNTSSKFLQENFTNEYGSGTTTCAHAGCENLISYSGDTNCCAIHSNRCGECNKYIDEDAMFCMSCIEDALANKKNNPPYMSISKLTICCKTPIHANGGQINDKPTFFTEGGLSFGKIKNKEKSAIAIFFMF